MNTKIYRIIVIAIVSVIIPLSANAQKGEAVFGLQAGYTSVNKSAVASLFLQYNLFESMRLSPEIGGVLRNNNLDAFTADLNLHFPLKLGASQGELYPLMGINVSAWTRHHFMDLDIKDVDVTTRTTKAGANLGAGFQYKASDKWKFKIEAKYVISPNNSTFVAYVGMGYIF